MSEFVVSARKYRPSSFKDVVGQSAITNTLDKAIQSNKLAQSFLFCGPRGVGKTTCARIFAKEINRFASDSLNDDFSFNIFELDAASNNSVDDIRNLTDQVRVPPQIGKYKVYIIDEVHMLSQSAFNAFLKTLEEPPAHAKFILATTEKHKIIPTILSRCQIFDFKSIQVSDIVNQLISVSKSENIDFDLDALNVIAHKCGGSMRDALSMYDRLIDSSEKSLTYKSVVDNLNILDYGTFIDMTDAIISGNISKVILLLDNIINNGFDAHHFIIGLSSHFRDLLMCKDSETLKILDKTEELKNAYCQQSVKCSLPFLVSSLDIFNSCDVDYRLTSNKRLLIELTLLRIVRLIEKNPLISNEKSQESIGKNEDLPNEIVESNSKLSSASNLPVDNSDTSEINEVNDILHSDLISKNEDLPNSSEKSNSKLSSTSNIPVDDNDVTVINEVLNSDASKSKLKSQDISIDSIINPIKIDEDPTQDHKSLDFSESDMLVAWNKYANDMKAQGKKNLFVTMTVSDPKLLDNYVIKHLILNETQNDIIKENMSFILSYLRGFLKNDLIVIDTEISEDSNNDVPYTNKDKFDRMSESNPNIKNLQTKLGLDTEY